MDSSRSTGWEYAEPACYKVIDTHVHVWETDGVMGAHSGVQKDTPHATPGLRSAPPSWSSEPTDSGRVELLLEDMERCGVDGAVLVQTSFSTWNNEYVAAAALRFPSRCRSMGMVDPLDPEAVKHAMYWMDQRGMSGFRFHPSYYHTGVASNRPGMDRSTHASGGPIHGEILKLPHNEALFDAIQARGGIVQLHSPQPEILQVDYAARKWPDITWILDHMSYPYPLGDMSSGTDLAKHNWAGYRPVLELARHPNIMMKISDVHNRSHEQYPYKDMKECVQLAVGCFGKERVMWGTGYPDTAHRVAAGWPPLEDELKIARHAWELSDDEVEWYLGKTAQKLFFPEGSGAIKALHRSMI